MKKDKQKKIDRLIEDYTEYLHELSNKDLDLMGDWKVITIKEAKELEKRYFGNLR